MLRLTRHQSPVTSAAAAVPAEAARPHRGPRPRPAGQPGTAVLGATPIWTSSWIFEDTQPEIGMLVSKPSPMGNLVSKDP